MTFMEWWHSHQDRILGSDLNEREIAQIAYREGRADGFAAAKEQAAEELCKRAEEYVRLPLDYKQQIHADIRGEEASSCAAAIRAMEPEGESR